MPRKVDPRWGEDGYDPEDDDDQSWTPVEISNAELAELAGMLDIDPAFPDAVSLRAAITDIGNSYRRWHGRGADAFRREEARAALEELLGFDRIDYAAMTALNERALQCVHDSLLRLYPEIVISGDSVTVALMENRIDEVTLRSAIEDAIARLKATKGPEREGELAWAVAELCEVYQKATGRRATHSNKGDDLGYRQEPRSEAGKFVSRCFRIIDDGVRPHQISRALRHYINSPRRQRP